MDMTESCAPKSDQLDAVDLISGPQTFTITEVSRGSSDQPFNFHLAEFPRVWRPGKSMRRVIVAVWGPETSAYVGRRVTLYCDPTVEFGGEVVGGTRISHMSHIDGPKRVPLLVKRGRSSTFTVQPLKDAPAQKPHAPRRGAQAAPAAEQPDDLTRATEGQLQALHAALVEAGHVTGPQKGAAIEDALGALVPPEQLSADDADTLIAIFTAQAARKAEG